MLKWSVKGLTLILSLMAMSAVIGCTTLPPDRLVTPTPTHGALTEVAGFADQVTGVAVAGQDRVFVNFPRWGKEPRMSVGELLPDGSLRPYPDQEWNRRDDAAPQAHFICVQSVFADAAGNLWILDPASPSFQGVRPGGAKLLRVNLATNKVEQVIVFDDKAALPNSYLNDVRVAPGGDFAYVTDSGTGAIVVVNVIAGSARRLLADHPSTKAEPGVVPVIGGRELRDANGNVPQIHADGIALDDAGQYLYYHALTGRTLYRVETRYLKDPTISPAEVGRHVERVAVTGPTDGMAIDPDSSIYLTDLEGNGIIRRHLNGSIVKVVRDDRIQWPDSMAFGLDGYLYFTASQINLMSRFNGGVDRTTPPFRLFKVWPVAP